MIYFYFNEIQQVDNFYENPAPPLFVASVATLREKQRPHPPRPRPSRNRLHKLAVEFPRAGRQAFFVRVPAPLPIPPPAMIFPFRPFALLPALPFSATAVFAQTARPEPAAGGNVGGAGGSGGGAPTFVFLALLVPLVILHASCVLDFPKNQK
jgi:hypothetical protein